MRDPPALPPSPRRSATPPRQSKLSSIPPALFAEPLQPVQPWPAQQCEPASELAAERDVLVSEIPVPHANTDKGERRRRIQSTSRSVSAVNLIQLDGPSTDAVRKFEQLDEDGSGFLDRNELTKLLESLPRKMKKKKMARAMDEMDPDGNNQVTFPEFERWWTDAKEKERRALRRSVKDVFDAVDEDRSGQLNKEEFGLVATKAKELLSITPPFNLEQDWLLITQGVLHRMKGEVDRDKLGVSFMMFENWWKERLGVLAPDLPVLPEYMVQVVDEHSAMALKRRASMRNMLDADSMNYERSGAGLWHLLKERLISLVRMQAQWGNLHDIYDAQTESRYTVEPLPKWIRDPESDFSAVWDLLQVVFLLYVSVAVPIRACFDVEVPLWTFGFIWDLVVDVYFVVDVILNFRTAYFNRDGTREDRKHMIRINYMTTWFTIDFVSCLPLGYIPYFFDIDDMSTPSTTICTDCSSAAGAVETDSFRLIKALRLVRLSKMLRLARVRKILGKYGGDVNLQVYVSVGFTLFVIFFLVHMLTCVFYLIGKSDQVLPNGVVINGWVLGLTSEGEMWDSKLPDPVLSTRYITSTYLVLNSLENSNTDAEKSFAIFSEFVRDFILGLVAGLITTVSMSMNTFGEGSQEGQLRLRDLKNWMQKKKLPKELQMPITEYCHEIWNNRSGLNVNEFFCDVPPSMRRHLTNFLYGATIARNPLFRGLSSEVMSALCNRVHAMYVMPQQNVIREGEPGREMYRLLRSMNITSVCLSQELQKGWVLPYDSGCFWAAAVMNAAIFLERSRYMIITGELEVLSQGNRLGFLSEGSFFGETAVISPEDVHTELLRTRTVTAVTDSELCYLTAEDLRDMKGQYAELAARLQRFTSHGQMRLTKKVTKKLFGEGGELARRSLSKDFTRMMQVVKVAKEEAPAERVHSDEKKHSLMKLAHKQKHAAVLKNMTLAMRTNSRRNGTAVISADERDSFAAAAAAATREHTANDGKLSPPSHSHADGGGGGGGGNDIESKLESIRLQMEQMMALMQIMVEANGNSAVNRANDMHHNNAV